MTDHHTFSSVAGKLHSVHRCMNCKGHLSAAAKGCSKYQEVSKALKISVHNKGFIQKCLDARQSRMFSSMLAVRLISVIRSRHSK